MKHFSIAVLGLTLFGASVGLAQITLNPAASRSFGQPLLNPETGNPNLVEGRELFSPFGVALDTSASPPIIYVSDSGNNRILAWKNATGFTNGQPADLIIGQPDKFSTSVGGPKTTFSSGLSTPNGIAVLNGDLYVVDAGNNRVLRYRKPFAQNGSVFPDLWIGQPTLSSSTANFNGVTGQSLNLQSSATIGLAFDGSGNLWVADPGNNRVLRFLASAISCSNCGGMSADIELGQPSLSTRQTGLNVNDPNAALIGNQFNAPAALALDASGNLYVSDAGINGEPGRVLVFGAPITLGANAARILGVYAAPGQAQETPAQQYQTWMSAPAGIFIYPNGSVGVVDTGFSRILTFPPLSQWQPAAALFSPMASAVYGQPDFGHVAANGTQSPTAATPPASAGVLARPSGVFFSQQTNELYVADSGNNRVVVLPVGANAALGPNASRVLGQDLMTTDSINLIEGREFQFVSASGSTAQYDSAIAIDTSSSTPHIYISDPGNNRVLGFKDMRTLKPGAIADIVIGQANFTTGLCNYPSGDSAQLTASGLCAPRGLLVDSHGNLYVADSANGRVLRFPAPFSYTGPAPEPADLVLGQQTFTASIKDPSSSTMNAPYGLAFSGSNGLVVSDAAYNRVLFFPFSGGGTFVAGTDNGRAATVVYGQNSFSSVSNGATDASLNFPHHIACDSNGQVYVADTGNGRVAVFPDPKNPQTAAAGTRSVFQIGGLNGPQGIYVNPTTGEIWVTNSNSSTAVRFPQFENLIINPTALGAIQDYSNTLAVAQDNFGDLVLADATNRVSIFYPGLMAVNGANFEASKDLAPGMIASVFPQNASNQFGTTNATFTTLPLPTSLGDIQVLFNGTAAPLFFVSPGQVNFQVPSNAPTTGGAEVDVVQASTQQILSSNLMPMNSVSPGLFLCPGGQSGPLRQGCILNQDNTVNSPSNPAARGSTIQIFATGQGFVPNAPADGNAATAASPAQAFVDVLFNGQPTGSVLKMPGDNPPGGKFVQYSGLAPQLVGVWQINVVIPMSTVPDNQVQLNLIVNNNIAEPDVNTGYKATVAVKQ